VASSKSKSRCAALTFCWWAGVALLAACAEPRVDALRFGLASAPITLDPRQATDAASERINRLLYQSLVDFDEQARPRPALARWEKLSPTHYRFILGDQGRLFHDGSRLTAADVKATYDSVLDERNGSPQRAVLAVIRRIETPDADTIDFHLVAPDPLFPGRLVIGILPAAGIAAGHPFNRAPLGSGPFAFRAWPEEGRLRLLRRGDGRLFEFLRVADPTVRVLKLLRGELDMVQNDLPPELVRYLMTRKELRVSQQRGSNFSYLGFNLEDGTSGNPALRAAVAHALDREAIIRYVWHGSARPANALLPPGHWAGNPALAPYPHDLAQARALLRQAGFDEGHPAHLVYKTSSDPFRVRLATIIQQQLAQAGIQVEVRSYDWGTFYGDIKAGRFQMYSLSWVGVKSPDIFNYVFHSASVPPTGANRGRYANPAADRLIEAALAADDEVAQARLYRELQALLLSELPYVPLWYEDHVFAARRDISGYTLASDGNYDGLVNVERRDRAVVMNGL